MFGVEVARNSSWSLWTIFPEKPLSISFPTSLSEATSMLQKFIDEEVKPSNSTISDINVCVNDNNSYNVLGEEDLRSTSIRTDNAAEFKSAQWVALTKRYGIRMQYTTPYTPEFNGVSERSIRELIFVARTLLDCSRLAMNFWAEAVSYACHVKNCLPTSANLGNLSAYEIINLLPPDLSKFKVFGCNCFVLIEDKSARKGKFAPVASRGSFLGLDTTSPGYRVLIWKTGKVSIARSVIFDEREPLDKNINNFLRKSDIFDDPFSNLSIDSIDFH